MVPMKGLVAHQRVCHARWAPCHPQVCAAICSSRTEPPSLAREREIVFREHSGLGMAARWNRILRVALYWALPLHAYDS